MIRPREFKTTAVTTAAGLAVLRAVTGAAAETTASVPLVDKMAGDQLIGALRTGGYVIYIRHATTEKDYADQISAKIGDCSTQRMLSADGWREARNVGAAFVIHQISGLRPEAGRQGRLRDHRRYIANGMATSPAREIR